MWYIPNKVIVFDEDKPRSCGDNICPFGWIGGECLLQKNSQRLTLEEQYENCPIIDISNLTNGERNYTMTKEEAIDFLGCRRAYYASLSTDPSPYVKATKVCGYTLAESANACLMAIEALKQALKMEHWIPVSERLPERVEWYLTSIKWDDGTERVTTSWFDGMSFKTEVVAWMPLPEPYKVESEE